MRVCREVIRTTAAGKAVICGRSIPVGQRRRKSFAGAGTVCVTHRSRALRAAVREMYALRGCPRPEPEHENESERDEEPEFHSPEPTSSDDA